MHVGQRSSLNILWIPVLIAVVVSTESTSDDKSVASLLDDFWQWRLKESPEFATRIGLHHFDDLLEEFTEESFSKQKLRAEDLLNQTQHLQKFRDLSQEDNVSVEVLKYMLNTYINGYEYRRFTMYNPNRFITEWKRMIRFMKFETEADYRDLLARFKLLPKQVTEKMVMMTKAIKLGTTPHRTAMERANMYRDVQHESVVNITESIFFGPFKKIPLAIPLKTRLKLQQRGAVAIREWVQPAWQRLHSFLQTEYIPSARPNVGMASLPGGLGCYQSALQWHTTTTLSAQEVHDIGSSEVQRLHDLMLSMVEEDGFEGGVRDYIDHISTQEKYFYSSEVEMVLGYKELVESIHKKLLSVLHKIPLISMTTQGYSSDVGSLGYYTDPSLDGSRPGTFFANVYKPNIKPKFDMLALTLHEAEPGHHTQAAYALEENLPHFRRAIEFRKYYAVPYNWPFMTAYIEGWALYAEYLGESMGVYKDRHSLFSRYASESFRAARLVVDTGIHALNWSPEYAEEYLHNHTTLSSHVINSEVKRYITMPAQACAYKIGELKIMELRRKAEKILGDDFDQRDFHHEILRLGAVPLSVLEDSISYWIQNWTSSSSDSTQRASSAMSTILFTTVVVSIFVSWW